MAGDEMPVLEDAQFGRVMLDLERPSPGGAGDGVEVAAHRDHPVLADPPFDRKHGIVGDCRQRRQARRFLREGFVDDPARCGVNARIGHLGTPRLELGVQIIHVPEASRQEEVLADIAERPLDLALRFRAIWPASPR